MKMEVIIIESLQWGAMMFILVVLWRIEKACRAHFSSKTKHKGKCATCRHSSGKYGACTVSKYWKTTGLELVCFEGELWKAK